ncbi:MAG: DegT/DnrJ/EryC1/StrS family aminotransferase [Thermoguttaceae bacterium]|jgi:dTDP-4-amino-4,6-dideoxygalactose transaminase|nr:DegT/DnrJ/EryC1/StrS family aminotransferase [Thermoguttaceae bacterium]
MKDRIPRRRFVQAAAGSAALAWLGSGQAPTLFSAEAAKPALLGGTPVHQGGWPGWPGWRTAWESPILDVLRSGHWSSAGGGGRAAEFEAAYAKLLGAAGCVATASGTTALLTALHVMGVDAGDEVIVSPYTFIATYNVVLMHKALPVFADTDPATLTMDPASIESRITDRTRAILPVHIYGMPCDMDPINAIAKKHNLAVVEDACQAWLAEYKGRKCGTLGDLGCFSFQNSKHIASGEGGAVTGNRVELVDRCHAFHDCGRAHGTFKGRGCFSRGSNFRMTHYQAALLLQQIDKLVTETQRRRENADYLTAGLKQIPGIQPARLPENSRAVWHLYPFRYDPAEFHGLSRDKFMRALSAEGVPCGGGYHEQYYDGLLDEAINSRGFKRLFSAERLKAYRESFRELSGNRTVCQTTVGLFNTLLLSERSAMDHIIEAVRKIHAHSAALAKTS